MLSHLSIPSLHQMVTLSTHISANNCTPPSLPLVQLPTTDPSSTSINAHNYTSPSLPPFQLTSTADPSSPSADDEEVVVLGAVFVPPAEATSPAINLSINDSTHAAGKEDTEISDVVAFFNPILKKPRCNTLCNCFDITPMASRGCVCVFLTSGYDWVTVSG
jgi:hypothetical protein